MKLSSLLRGVETQDVYEEREVERVTDKDSENLNKALFVCVNGNRCDGHTLARKAVENGAIAVVTDRDIGLEQQIVVKDTRAAFARIAANFYGNPEKKIKVIGITGTNGKTSTCHIIKGVLDYLGHSCGLIGTVKNVMGTVESESVLTTPEPMELYSMLSSMAESGCEYCVMEVSSQALDQKRVDALRFCAAAVTNITPEHLDYHLSMENYTDAKLKIQHLSDYICYNSDDAVLSSSKDKIVCKNYTYSTVSDRADFTAKNIVCNENGIRYEFVGTDCISRISSSLPGRFSVYNTLCAASVLKILGFSADEISDGIKEQGSVTGRAEIIPVPKNILVMRDYAHTPDGLENILNAARELTKGKLFVVFGCGGDRDKSKRAEMGRIAGELSDYAVVTSDNPRTENPLLIINDILCGMEKSRSAIAVIENRRQAIEFALKKARRGDTVLLAGKGHETYQIIGNKKIPFDEKKITEEFFG